MRVRNYDAWLVGCLAGALLFQGSAVADLKPLPLSANQQGTAADTGKDSKLDYNRSLPLPQVC
jgi:hypothetical protein